MHVRAFRRSSQGENEEWYVHFVQALLRPVRKSYCRHGLHLFVFEFCILSVREKMIACSSVLSRTILLSQTSISLLVLRFVHAIFPVFTTEALI